MKTETKLLRELPIDVFNRARDGDAWDRSPLSALPDAHLAAVCVETITPPKIAKPSSFVLHAPLELLARTALLAHVASDARAMARRRIAEVAVRYANAGAEVEEVHANFSGVNSAIATLYDALLLSVAAGDDSNPAAAGAADTALLWLLPRVPLAQLRAALIDVIAPMLGAAGHAPILLAALPNFEGRIAGVGGLLRAPLRTLAAAANTRLRWHESIGKTAIDINHTNQLNAERALRHCLTAPARVNAASTSIAPTLLAVEKNGDAARLLTAPSDVLTVKQAEKILLRAAALSMLQDDPIQVPYGWTHCLTLPQALLQSADASRNHGVLIAVAATHVLAYRATFGAAKIDFDFAPVPTASQNVLDIDASTAASVAFHADSQLRPALKQQLATYAAMHRDAHLVKYTLACFDAAERDPEAASLFYAAAAYLGAWWRGKDGGS